MSKTFYITTPIYYPSAKLHIGHAYCSTMADTIARYHRAKGDDTYFLTGSDEHGEKIQKNAEAKGVTPKEFVDEIVLGIKQLWKDMDVKYDDVNFFDNDFDYSEFLEASLSKNSGIIKSKNSLKTPNNTTDGMLKKAWIIENGTRYLLKGGYKNELLQPFNEVLASEICRRLGFYHVEYILDTYKDMVVSKCPFFIKIRIQTRFPHCNGFYVS